MLSSLLIYKRDKLSVIILPQFIVHCLTPKITDKNLVPIFLNNLFALKLSIKPLDNENIDSCNFKQFYHYY